MQQRNTHFFAKTYPIETGLKLLFIFMAIFNMNYATTVGFIASLMGMLRMLKTIQFNKQYLQKVLMNPHGQNILYIGMGCYGSVNFMFFAPLVLYFSFALVQFYNMKFPGEKANPKFKPYIDSIRNNKYYIMEGKSKIEIFYFLYLLVTIPIDLNRILKCFMLAQFNLLKYRATAQTRTAASSIHNYVNNKIQGIGFLHRIYNKIIDFIYKIATNPGQ